MSQTYTFASWNVNGLRAVLKKDPSFIQIAQELNVDILALQETKLQEGQVDIDLPGYHQTWSYAQRKGYSGTAVFSRQEPQRVLPLLAFCQNSYEAAQLHPLVDIFGRPFEPGMIARVHPLLQDEVLATLLENFAAHWVRVSVAKLGMMPGVKRVGVVIERSV